MKQISARLVSIDMMRGLVMVLMALDHTRDYFSNAMFSPTDLSQTNAAYFLTRWITHLCAPIFMFLAGTCAYLSKTRWNSTTQQLSGYLIRRGVVLIILELTLIRFGWTFNLDYSYGIAQVVWALGWSMIVLAALVYLPGWVVVVFAITLIAGHNVLDSIQPRQFGGLAWLWTVLHIPGNIEYMQCCSLYVFYPLIPWIAVMAAGYCMGPLFLQSVEIRQTRFVLLGLTAIMLFLVLRISNIYGDPQPWSPQKSTMMTLLSILKCEKYPPSLLYLLMTLGPMFIGLALFERAKIHCAGLLLLEFGKAPLLFYIIHIFLIHGAAYAITLYRGLPTEWLVNGSAKMPFPTIPSPEYGFDLIYVYVIWLGLLVVLYPVCAAYNSVRLLNEASKT